MLKKTEHNAHKNFATNLGLLILSVTIILAATEFCLRLFGYDEFETLKKDRELFIRPSSNPDVKYELTPNTQGYVWGTDTQINSQGYRGRLGSPGKFKGFRAIAIGDSITFGNSIPAESTFSHQLHRFLNKSSSAYEILNFGVSGYDILQDVSLVEHKALQYNPDLIILGYCHNDLGVVSLNLKYIKRAQKFQKSWIFNFRIARFILRAIEKKRSGSWLLHKNELRIFQKDNKGKISGIGKNEHKLRHLMQACPALYPVVWYKDEIRVGRLRYCFERLAALGKKGNFSVVVVIFPWLVDNAKGYPFLQCHKIVTYEAHRVGFDVLEVVDDFMAVGMEKIRTRKKDLIHPNAIGHRIVAKKLTAYIRERWPENSLRSASSRR